MVYYTKHLKTLKIMMTVNLEKKLIKENKKLITPKELLLINEYEKHAGIIDNDVVSRVGLNSQVKNGKRIKERISKKQKQTQKYNQDRVFHISQIRSICKKYYLRFLWSEYYKGTIDDQLPEKITTFEVAYGDKCDGCNIYIIAPLRSFSLEQKPKDPLLFYKINDEYYYLIHKWGNDLNLFRRLLSYLSNPFWSMLTIAFVFTLPLLLIPKIGLIIYSAFFSTLLIMLTFYNSMKGWNSNDTWDDPIRLVKVNKWDSKYK